MYTTYVNITHTRDWKKYHYQQHQHNAYTRLTKLCWHNRICIFILVSSLPILSSIAVWHCRMTSIKVKALPQCLGFAASNVSFFLSYNGYDAIGGTLYILKLEKIDSIEGELCQECLLRFPRYSKSESWPGETLFENVEIKKF